MTRDQDEAGRAERILAAAEEVLAERGYDGMSIGEVARRAGVNKGLVFYYYESKAGLFDTVLTRYYELHRDALADPGEQAGDVRARVHGLLDSYLDFMEANRLYPRLVQQEVARGGEHLGKIRENMAGLKGRLEHLLGDILPPRGPLAARHFFVSFMGIVTSYYTYAPALETLWGGDPTSDASRRERREHIHWLVDAIVDRLDREEAA